MVIQSYFSQGYMFGTDIAPQACSMRSRGVCSLKAQKSHLSMGRICRSTEIPMPLRALSSEILATVPENGSTLVR